MLLFHFFDCRRFAYACMMARWLKNSYDTPLEFRTHYDERSEQGQPYLSSLVHRSGPNATSVSGAIH